MHPKDERDHPSKQPLPTLKELPLRIIFMKKNIFLHEKKYFLSRK
jgi:hypothetical protein